MCECQPNIEMFTAFEPPLFQRYDLSVEFLRRRRRVRDLLAAEWPRLSFKDDDVIRSEILELCVIEPLRLVLQLERLVVEPSGVVEGTSEPCYLYRKFIPFAGDVELWHLSPGGEIRDQAEGAVAYLEYVTGVVETNDQAAFQNLSRNVQAANRMIALQEGRIHLFNDSLVRTVARELRKRRRAETDELLAQPCGTA